MTEIKNKAEMVKLASSPLEGEPNRPSRFGGEYNKRNIPRARSMRKEMTAWEYRLWLRLKANQLGGYKFRRQQPIGPYIVDFLNVEKKLVVKLDGGQHAESEADKKRDEYLRGAGYYVLRFWNTDVNANLEGVIARILEVLESPHQIPRGIWLPLRGGARCGENVPDVQQIVDGEAI